MHQLHSITINNVLRDLLDQFVIAYLDNILKFLEDLVQDQSYVHMVLERLSQHGLFMKCALGQTFMEFLGFILSPEGLKMDLWKVQTVHKWKVPQNFRQLQRFLGFITNFAQLVSPLAIILFKKKKSVILVC